MITASIGSHRFESGPTFHFNGSDYGALSSVIDDPTSSVNYVNTLPNVNTTIEEMRLVAASGVARLAIAGPDTDVLERAGNMLVGVAAGDLPDMNDYGTHRRNVDDFGGKRLTNQMLDSASVLATRRNREEETAEIVRDIAPTDNGYFVIALANGGLISAARTFLRLGEGDHKFGMVKYSMHKSGDSQPDLYPYPHDRRRWLAKMAQNRQVVILDEDYTSGATLKTAVKYFANLLDTNVAGVAPVELGRRIMYKPLIVRPDSY